jgi:ABC-type antimicrobial peptide transport system permease subunit
VRSNLSVDAVTKLVRSALATVDPGLAVALPQSMSAIVAQAVGQTRLMMWLLGIFAGVALLLASIGIYGAVAYTVEQRTGEIGVRMALGAQRSQVLWMVLGESLLISVAGVAVGVPLAIAGAQLMRSMLFGVMPGDSISYFNALLGVTLVALIASAIPARRAASVDPIVALRYE